jgi:hypothetical protein
MDGYLKALEIYNKYIFLIKCPFKIIIIFYFQFSVFLILNDINIQYWKILNINDLYIYYYHYKLYWKYWNCNSKI